MASKELLEMMNKAIASELQVSIQYMWQHVLWSGVKAFAVKDEFKVIAIEEMKHAEAIAERLAYLGGTPTTKPDPIFIGQTLKEMTETNKKNEEEAIELYKWVCGGCGNVYDEGEMRVLFKNLPDDWTCSNCKSDKSSFTREE